MLAISSPRLQHTPAPVMTMSFSIDGSEYHRSEKDAINPERFEAAVLQIPDEPAHDRPGDGERRDQSDGERDRASARCEELAPRFPTLVERGRAERRKAEQERKFGGGGGR